MICRWSRDGRLERRTVIIGADMNGENLINALRAQEDFDIEILGLFDDRNDRARSTLGGSPSSARWMTW